MFKRVFVPLDGSVRAERAIPTAVQLVRASGGTLILAHVRSMDSYFYLASAPAVTQDLIEGDLEEGEKYLARIAQLPELCGLSLEKIVMYGPVANTLLSLIAAQAADMVVLNSHGRTGFTRWALGSVAEKIAKYSPAPVLVLREGGPVPVSSHPEALRPLRTLVPLDGSVYSKAALEPAAEITAALATQTHGTIHLLRVVKPSSAAILKQDEYYSNEWWYDHLLHRSKVYLSALETHIRQGLLAPALSRLKLMVTWSVALDSDVAHAIVRVAENGEDAEGVGAFGGCNLIVMATHGRHGLQRWTMGSVTERVLHSTRLPILVVRPAEVAASVEHKQEAEAVIG
jgi:nucleotide-binding universal stress UspA family protein